ncbi:MAG: type III polyketide synthase [Balneolaceae bacterium]|nr:type III polyketide synthase [Balneolaceae bacterium]
MSVYIHNINTAVPESFYSQDFLRDKMKEYLGDERSVKSIIHRIYSHSGIQKRHSVVDDFHANGDPRFFFQKDGTLSQPSTGSRNDRYAEHARELFVAIAENLISEHPTFTRGDITHVITVSCTGFFAPGPDYEIVKQLNLSPDTQRYHLGFMGCYAAFPALRMANAFCETDEDAVAMVICLELCSLHLQQAVTTDSLISGSVFADGGAGMLVSRRKPEKNTPAFRIKRFASSIAEQSEKDMAWSIGDTGFDMVLSTYVPDIIQANMEESIEPLLNELKTEGGEIDRWAVHPGGRAILDKIEKEIGLSPEAFTASRKVLANYGNMSSGTVLFVLKELLDTPMNKKSENLLTMAFGPGLTIESALLEKITG